MVWSSVLSVHYKLTIAELVSCWYWTCVLADSKLMHIQHWCLTNFWSIDCLNLQPYCFELWSKKTELMQVLGGADLVAVIFRFDYISKIVQWLKDHQSKIYMQAPNSATAPTTHAKKREHNSQGSQQSVIVDSVSRSSGIPKVRADLWNCYVRGEFCLSWVTD